jgi:hypothetical protein
VIRQVVAGLCDADMPFYRRKTIESRGHVDVTQRDLRKSTDRYIFNSRTDEHITPSEPTNPTTKETRHENPHRFPDCRFRRVRRHCPGQRRLRPAPLFHPNPLVRSWPAFGPRDIMGQDTAAARSPWDGFGTSTGEGK